MSKQSSQHPTESDEQTPRKSHKKRKGKFELWVRWNWGGKGWTAWMRWRKYETIELANQNKAKHEREFSDMAQWEVRVNE